jgi:predicted transcriptional regulator
MNLGMKDPVLKKYLIQIAERLTPESTLEDVYEQLSLLADIDESELEEEKGEVLSHEEVTNKSREWLK